MSHADTQGKITPDRHSRLAAQTWTGKHAQWANHAEADVVGLVMGEEPDHRRTRWSNDSPTWPHFGSTWRTLKNVSESHPRVSDLNFDRYEVWLVISSFKISVGRSNTQMRLEPWNQRSSGLRDARRSCGRKWGAPLKTERLSKR